MDGVLVLGSSARFVLPKGAKEARAMTWQQAVGRENRATLSEAEEREAEAALAALAALQESAPAAHASGNLPRCHGLPPGFSEDDGSGAPMPDDTRPRGGRGLRE